MKSVDGNLKILFLVFVISFFDFFEFTLSSYYLSKINGISGTLQTRLGVILMVFSSFFYWYLLKMQLFKHHIFSLGIIGICLILLIISEYLFNTHGDIFIIYNLSYALLYSILSQFFIVYINIIEKYLIDTDFLNPFLLLAYEGIIGLIFAIICIYFENAYKPLKNVYMYNSTSKFTFFVFLLLFYTIFGALKNIYKMFTISLFTPMNKNLADIMINPLYIIYYFAVGIDFVYNGQRNYYYFFMNLLLSIIFDILGLIFNEFIVLFCCGLDSNTYKTISLRAQNNSKLAILPLEETLDEEERSNNSNSTLSEL